MKLKKLRHLLHGHETTSNDPPDRSRPQRKARGGGRCWARVTDRHIGAIL